MAQPDGLVPGFRAAGVHCGIKQRGSDLALIASDVPAVAAGVFTQSTVVGAPVQISRARIRRRRPLRGVVVNSGISNVAMGDRGLRDAEAMGAAAARALGCPPAQVLMASTGVIGVPLPMGKIRAGIVEAHAALDEAGLPDAARAIMTTDTVPKLVARSVRVGGRRVRLAGIAKGSGMIEPHMATMLSFLITDAAVEPGYLQALLSAAADESYNRLTIDGEGSTSDTVLLLANGVAGNRPLAGPRSAGAAAFRDGLLEVATELTRALARDGEGASKLVTVRVSGARNAEQADRAARRIANSLLVKTAVFGRDPNWGRILQTIGAGQVELSLERATVKLCGVTVFRRGASAGEAARRRAGERLAGTDVAIEVDLARGRRAATLYTCDLTYDYVRINAEYTT